nr:DUF2007 domain-containing protein [uncultured Cohaesibacter sp.]
MEELIKTNNPITLSFVEALLRDADIPFQSLDHNMSTLYGSILNQIARRVLVDDAHLLRARQLLRDAGLEKELDCSVDDRP